VGVGRPPAAVKRLRVVGKPQLVGGMLRLVGGWRLRVEAMLPLAGDWQPQAAGRVSAVVVKPQPVVGMQLLVGGWQQ